MAQISTRHDYVNMTCNNCKFLWSYPVLKPNGLSNLGKMFYFELHICPHCKAISRDISTVTKFTIDIENNKECKQIESHKNENFAKIKGKQSYIYELYAYISLRYDNIEYASKSYIMAGKVEQAQRENYMNSVFYKPARDDKMIENSKQREQEMYKKAVDVLLKIVNDDNEDVESVILLALAYAFMGNKSGVAKYINIVAKKNLTNEQKTRCKEILTL